MSRTSRPKGTRFASHAANVLTGPKRQSANCKQTTTEHCLSCYAFCKETANLRRRSYRYRRLH